MDNHVYLLWRYPSLTEESGGVLIGVYSSLDVANLALKWLDKDWRYRGYRFISVPHPINTLYYDFAGGGPEGGEP
jgi:hypothetical protein